MTYSPASRLLTLLELLQSRPGVTAAQLAERLEVTGRSVRRYITTLQDLGIPVQAGRGRYGGYRLRPGYKLPPLLFTDDEALAVTLGLLAARQMGLEGTAQAVEGALAKVERVLPQAVRSRVQALQTAVTLDAPAPTPASAEHLSLLSAAAHEGRSVWLRYASRGGEPTKRLVDPYGLARREGRWYLVGHCHLRGEPRVFRLDRVLQVEPRDGRFARPAEFDALAFAVRSFAAMPERWLVEALLSTSLAAAQAIVPATFATLEDTPDGVLLRAYDGDLDHAARFLVGLGCPFRVLDPPELRDALRRLTSEIAHAVSDTTDAGLA